MRSVCGESSLVKQDMYENFLKDLDEKLKQYEPVDIYNCDETGLFWRESTKKFIVLNKEDKLCGKQAKERITILSCANSIGDKLDPLIISKPKKARSFKNKNYENHVLVYL